jgi:hypothetical protein
MSFAATLATVPRNALQVLGTACRAISVVRAPLVVSVLAAAALSLPDQVIEIYRLQGEQRGQAAGALIFAALVGVLLVYLAHALVKINGLQLCSTSRLGCLLLSALPGACGAILMLGLALGMWRAGCAALFASKCKDLMDQVPFAVFEKLPELVEIRDAAREMQGMLFLMGVICATFAACLLVLGGYLARLYWRGQSELARKPTRFWGLLGGGRAIIVGLLVGVALNSYMVNPAKGIDPIGAPAIFLLFVAVLAYLTSYTTAQLDRYRIPAITGLLIIAVGFSALDLNDNHELDQVVMEEGAPPHLNQTFKQWYETRADRDFYKDKPYPVFVVATSGGGLYAAKHTAGYLARLQDHCPTFAQHVFAISGVSGGSLGAAVFSSLAKESAQNGAHQRCKLLAGQATGPIEQRARRLLSHDFLAPLVAGTLFPDFVQRLLPFPVLSLSRARALDASFERAWRETEQPAGADKALPNPFEQSFREHWKANGAAPALVLNATEIDHGLRYLFSPFRISLKDDETGDTFNPNARWSAQRIYDDDLPDQRDVKLSTAVGVSARFPWITPAATITSQRNWGTQKRRLVDGGYFENSGVETAHDIIAMLAQFERRPDPEKETGRPWIKLNIILIGGYTQIWGQHYNRMQHGLGEIFSPIKGLLSTRERRGYLAWYRYTTSRCERIADAAQCPALASSLNLDDFRIPLGWLLSPVTARLIEFHTGRAERAPIWLEERYDMLSENENGMDRIKEMIFGAIQENDVSVCNVMHLLNGKSNAEVVEMRQRHDARRWEIIEGKAPTVPPPTPEELCGVPIPAMAAAAKAPPQ